MNNNNPKLSIGLPIYNGENFLEKRIENILSQTFNDFELIISDNASTDNSLKISEKFKENEGRIKIIHQEKNMGSLQNFEFVLKQAVGNYFVWAAVDDLWEETFLEKNITFLDNNHQYVGSISKVIKYGKDTRDFKTIEKDNSIKKKYKKVRRYFRPFEVFSLTGNQNERINKFLKNPSALIIYSVFRTDSIKKCMNTKKMAAPDLKIILKILEFGEIKVLNEILFQYYSEGLSSRGLINQFSNGHIPLVDVIFPYFSFLDWVRKKFGTKFLVTNSRFFTLFFGGIISNVREFFSSNENKK